MVGSERVRGIGVARDAGSGMPSGDARGGVVRSFGRAVERPCARPSCSAPARATLRFVYADREASVEQLADEPSPQTYDLCATHAARTSPPHGWTLRDRRPEDERRPDAPPQTPADLGGDRTVAVLAAALRATPDSVSEDAVDVAAAEVGPAIASGGPAPSSFAVSTTTDGTRAPAGPAPGSVEPESVGPAEPESAASKLTAVRADAQRDRLHDDDDPMGPTDGGASNVPRPPLAARRHTQQRTSTKVAADW